MSIIQTIRDKYAKWAVVGIALAIIGFLLMDASVGRSRLMSGSGGSSVGSVNGKKISVEDFRKLVDIQQQNIESGNPGVSSDAKQGQAVNDVWNQEINKIILDGEVDKLGFTVTENERADMIGGSHPDPEAMRYLSQQGQQYDGAQALQILNQALRGNDAVRKAQAADLLNYLDRVRLDAKYKSLFTNSANIPRWIVESENADASRIASISFIQVPYTDSALLSGTDTSIKISDEEIMAYVNKHKKQFKQTESRGVTYVAFSAAPSKADTLATRDRVASLNEKFKNAPDTKMFLDREGSDFGFSDGYTRPSDMRQANKDTLLRIPVGEIYGPYLDNTHFVTAKMVDSKMVPDSVDVRHILVQTADLDRNTGVFTPKRDTAEARKFMNDSVLTLLASGVSFDSVVRRYSDDGGSKEKGGVYKNVTWDGGFAMPFVEFSFINPVGSKRVVYTDFGFHYIEVLKHSGAADNRVVKIAFLAREIETSQETETEISSKANTFAGKARDLKSFDETYEKELKPLGMTKGIIASVGPSEYKFGQLGESRQLIRKIYEAKKGEVIQPEKVGLNYVVAVVTEVLSEGTKNASAARGDVEMLLRKKKKADIIRKKIGNITTLEAAAAALGKQVQKADSVSSSNARTMPYDYKLLGAAFNPANKGKVVPELIEGREALYLLQVHNTGTAPLASANVTEQRANMINGKKFLARPLEYLREAATIKDKRKDHY